MRRSDQDDGLARVARVWDISRAGVYRILKGIQSHTILRHKSEQKRARASGSSSRPPAGQRAFALHGGDLGVEQFVVHGDLAHLGFQPGDLVVAVIAFAFFQGCSRACERTLAPLG